MLHAPPQLAAGRVDVTAAGLPYRNRDAATLERLSERARPMIDYLKVFERSSNVFPGFETEVQGLYRERDAAGAVRFYTYVVRE